MVSHTITLLSTGVQIHESQTALTVEQRKTNETPQNSRPHPDRVADRFIEDNGGRFAPDKTEDLHTLKPRGTLTLSNKKAMLPLSEEFDGVTLKKRDRILSRLVFDLVLPAEVMGGRFRIHV